MFCSHLCELHSGVFGLESLGHKHLLWEAEVLEEKRRKRKLLIGNPL